MSNIINLTNPYSWGLFFLGLIIFCGSFWKPKYYEGFFLVGEMVLLVSVLVHFILW